MFTGIVEATGIVQDIQPAGASRVFWIKSSLSPELKIDQSVSHDGACLTVEEISNDSYRVTAISETLKKSTLGSLTTGGVVNLERSLVINARLDGHFVQGHVDGVGVCRKVIEKEGSWEYEFSFPKKFAPLVIEKGSITVNGISLTAFEVGKKSFRVAIIPFTHEHTNIRFVKQETTVNLEFDMIGKYILRKLSLG
jgi:riboflavin synthase